MHQRKMVSMNRGADVSYKIWECEAGHWRGQMTVDSAAEAIKAAEAIQARGFGVAFIQQAEGSERIPLSEFRKRMSDDV